MASKRTPRDPRVGMMIVAFSQILRSVPTDVQPDRKGPLSPDEIGEASALMDRLHAEIKAERETPAEP